MKLFSLSVTLFFLFFFIETPYANNNNEEKDSLLAKSYVAYADSLYRINAHDSAVFYYDKASSIFRELKDWENISRCEIWETYMYIDLGQYEKAIVNIDEAITFFNRFLPPNNIYSFNCSIKKSTVFFQKGNYNQSIQTLNNAIKIFSTNPTSSSSDGQKKLASAYFEYGNSYLETGKLDSAVMMYKKTLELREKHYERNHDLIVDCYNNLGIIYSYFGDYEIAVSYMYKALKSREEKNGFAHSLTAWSYTNLGILNLYIGNFDKALEYVFKGLESRKQCLPADHIEFASSYSVIANIYNETGNYQEALKYHNMALDIYKNKLGENNIHVSGIYNNIADNYNKQNEFEKALHYFLKSLKIINQVSPDVVIPNHVLCQFNIADTYLKMNNIDSALVYNSLALKSNFAPVHKQQNIDAILDFDYAFLTLEQKAAIYMERYKSEYKFEDLRIANDAYLKYIELLDYLRIRATGVDSKLTLSYLNNGIMNSVINTSYLLSQLDPGYFHEEKVGYLIEKNKANVLQEMLDKTNNDLGLNMPDSLAEKWKEISGSLIALKAEQMFAKEKGRNVELYEIDERIFLLQEERAELNDYVQEKYPNLEKGISDNLRFDRGALKNDSLTAILDYYVSDSLLYICFIDSKQTKVRTVAIDSSLEVTTNKYLRGIKKNRIGDFANLSSTLFNYLIQPVADLIQDKEKLVIIPDKYLYYLPFETLSNDKNVQEFRNKDYLIRRFDMLYHYSATIYCDYLQRNSPGLNKKLNFVGFAPVFDEGNTPVKISPQCLTSITDTTFQNSQEILRSFSYDGKTYNGLPYSRMEINTIADIFDKQGYVSERYLYSKANEEKFKQVCEQYRIVHLASHGFINEHNPELSGIIFYPDTIQKQTSANDDKPDTKNFSSNGILFTGEMYNLKLNADLVVLSACETGLGSMVKGEGVMAMTRGFIYAGASNILFSLWKVGDKNTYQLMVDFYSCFLAGDSYSRALRKSKLNLISDEETAFPKFWSGFTLLGMH